MAVKTAVLAFNGRTDRIDSRPGPDGPELVIVDYKTGRTGLDADDARGSQALALYAYAAERVFRRPCRRVELHHLPTGTVAAHDHTPESLARQLSRAEETARDIMAAERAVAEGADPDEAFPTTPGPALRLVRLPPHLPDRRPDAGQGPVGRRGTARRGLTSSPARGVGDGVRFAECREVRAAGHPGCRTRIDRGPTQPAVAGAVRRAARSFAACCNGPSR